MRGGTVMREYWGQPEATAEALRDGWYHSGDAGYLDERRLPVPGRPGQGHDRDAAARTCTRREVENALSTHPAVGSVAVIGVPDDVWGEAVHAIVVLRADAEVTEDELKDHARPTLAGYKVPKTIELRDEPLPCRQPARCSSGSCVGPTGSRSARPGGLERLVARRPGAAPGPLGGDDAVIAGDGVAAHPPPPPRDDAVVPEPPLCRRPGRPRPGTDRPAASRRRSTDVMK